MRLSKISISLRLTLWFACIFLFGWVAFGAMMWVELKHNLTEERHNTLARRLDRLQDLLEKANDQSPEEKIQDYRDFARATGNGLCEIFRADGSRYFPSPSAAARGFAWPAIHSGEAESFQLINSAGVNYWVMTRAWQMDEKTVYLMAAAPAAYNQQVLDGFSQGLIASVPILLLISSLGGYWLSRSAMRPVNRITKTARSISIRNLSERLPETGSADELRRLSETFNAMLARLESAVGQIKRFTADASHELRGPLSFVRTVSEVALRNPSMDDESRQAFQDIVEEVAKAAVMLEDMLTLARADAQACEAVLQRMDIAPLLHDTCMRARAIAELKGLKFDAEIEAGGPVVVSADEQTLRRLCWILVDNAIKYTPAPGKVTVRMRREESQTVLEVMDTGVGIAAGDLPLIFDRFYRADPSRSQTEGSGLGLSIARWIAELHGGSLQVSSELDHGTTIRLLLPQCGTEI